MPDPWTPDQRPVRGSSWFPLDRDHRSAWGSSLSTDTPDNTVGFRTFRPARLQHTKETQA